MSPVAGAPNDLAQFKEKARDTETERVGGKANRSRLIGVPKSANSICGLLLDEDLN